jgi:hypothetical protein
MTEHQDILVALKGIADVTGESVGDRLVAGLWEKMIPQELCWWVNGPYRPHATFELAEWRAPTWSWAITHHGLGSGRTTLLVNCSDRIEATLEVDAAPNGKLTAASMIVRCKLLPAVLELWDFEEVEQCDEIDTSDVVRGGRMIFKSDRLELVAWNMNVEGSDIDVYMDDCHKEDLFSEAERWKEDVHILVVRNTHGTASFDSTFTCTTTSKNVVSRHEAEGSNIEHANEGDWTESMDDGECVDNSNESIRESTDHSDKEEKIALIAALILQP